MINLQSLRATIRPGTQVYTDEYDIDARLREWGYEHSTVCHGRGEYARDEDGEGFHEVHVNTLEGFWSLLRAWLRPHRGISQEKLPWDLGCFQFVHNTRIRGQGPLRLLLGVLLAQLTGIHIEPQAFYGRNFSLSAGNFAKSYTQLTDKYRNVTFKSRLCRHLMRSYL
jgi:transposase